MTCQNYSIGLEKGASISSLGSRVSLLACEIDAYLDSKSFIKPTFEPDGGEVPEDTTYDALRASLNDLAIDLLCLVNGPKTSLRDFIFPHYDLAAMQVALDRGFFRHVPLPSTPLHSGVRDEGTGREAASPNASVAQIAAKAGMDEARTGSILRLLASRRIFQRVKNSEGGRKHDGEDKRFAHAAMSATLARDADYHAMNDMQLDDMFKASGHLSSQISEFPHVSDSTHNAFHHQYGMTPYAHYELERDKGKRFGQSMSAWVKVNERGTELRDGFPWASLREGKVVDMGGGSGHISISLAREFPDLRFVVQDKSLVQLGREQEDLAGRVSFQRHDFFELQPVHDASVFLLRQILHNYSDMDSIEIIRALVPELEKSGPGTAVVINDIVLPDPGAVSMFEEHLLRQVDLCMMVSFGGKERSCLEWERLFHDADPRFRLAHVKINPKGLGLVQFHLMC
ncbi:putative O-methyltransferase [Xylariaceae sp. FL0594]|nr:putative O-methyltransferase [Xylariaceae sp. FL0594]